MNWLHAYLFEDETYKVASINLSNVKYFIEDDEDPYNNTCVVYMNQTYDIIKGYVKDVRGMLYNLKDGQDASLIDEGI